MPTPYVPPGVTIIEAVAPQVVPLVASASDVALVGPALGHETRTDQFVISGTEPVILPFLASSPYSKLLKIVSVLNALNPSEGSKTGDGFKKNTDWKENLPFFVGPLKESITEDEGVKLKSTVKDLGGFVKEQTDNLTVGSVAVGTGIVVGSVITSITSPIAVPVGPVTATASKKAGGELGESKTYFYKVTAINASGGETTASLEVTAKTAAEATQIVTLKWAEVAGASGYNIYRSEAAGNEVLYATAGAVVEYEDKGAGKEEALKFPPVRNNTGIVTLDKAAEETKERTVTFTATVKTNSSALVTGFNKAQTNQLQVGWTVAPIAGNIATNTTITKVNETSVELSKATAKSEAVAFTASAPETNDGTIARTGGGSELKDKTLVNVTYEFVPADYYNPVRLFRFSEVQARYGNGIENGKIASPLSLAAQKAFENGASSVICQPLFKLSSGSTLEYSAQGFIANATKPEAADIGKPENWSNTLQALNVVEGIDLIVPIIGASEEGVNDASVSGVISAVLGYEQQRNVEEQYIIACFGLDSSAGNAQGLRPAVNAISSACQAYAGYGQAQQNVVVNTTNFTLQLPNINGTIAVGGQYMAAAVAGAVAARPVAASLTRKNIIGFTSVTDLRSPHEKDEDAENGQTVIERVANGAIRCRHALTTDNAHGAARSELSVVRAKFNMVESVRETLENQIIGQIIADSNSPIIVRSAIVGVLSAMRSAGSIVAYGTPVCAISSLEPTTITASFSYRPAFTLNYINIVFSLDLSNNTVSLVETV